MVPVDDANPEGTEVKRAAKMVKIAAAIKAAKIEAEFSADELARAVGWRPANERPPAHHVRQEHAQEPALIRVYGRGSGGAGLKGHAYYGWGCLQVPRRHWYTLTM